MDSVKTLQSVNEFAKGYDEYVKTRNWNGPAFFFGMMYEYIEAGDKLLDLGTGTGLNLVLFKKAGLTVYGIDGSEEMLAICTQKKIATELALHDLAVKGYPFKSVAFNHVVSYAVFHLLGELEIALAEVGEMLRPDGIFGFSIAIYDPARDKDFVQTAVQGLYEQVSETSSVSVFRHTEGYLLDLLGRHGFSMLKKAEILAFRDDVEKRSVTFTIYLTRKRL